MMINPIETAPKDGTHILLKYEEGLIEGWYGKDMWGDKSWEPIILPYHGCGQCCNDTNNQPTHWMPLPKLSDNNND